MPRWLAHSCVCPRPGMVGTAGAGQSSLCLFMQPFHVARAWWSQGNRTGQLAPQFQKEEVGAASPIRPENWHRITSTIVIGQSSHRPAQMQGKGTQTHLPVGGAPSLIYHIPQCFLAKVAQGPSTCLYSKQVLKSAGVYPRFQKWTKMFFFDPHSSWRPQRDVGAQRIKSSNQF